METHTEAGQVVYQREVEMPANLVPAFIDARRRVIAMRMEEKGHTYVPDLDPAEQELIEKMASETPP